jgi:hypothetical protein
VYHLAPILPLLGSLLAFLAPSGLGLYLGQVVRYVVFDLLLFALLQGLLHDWLLRDVLLLELVVAVRVLS